MTALHHTSPTEPAYRLDLGRTSAGFGLAFTLAQLVVMVCMALVVLPHAGSPSDPALDRGQRVLDAADLYRVGNYAFMISGTLLLGFLGAVQLRLRRVDRTGVLATTALVAGTLLVLIWPLGGLLHDVALETAEGGTDLRILGGWDAVAPFSLAFSALPRLFFVGAIVLALRMAGESPWLQRVGVVLLPLSLVGTATLVNGAIFPLLALSTLGYELWVGAVAMHWLRSSRRPSAG
jgi:hypothetical protein